MAVPVFERVLVPVRPLKLASRSVGHGADARAPGDGAVRVERPPAYGAEQALEGQPAGILLLETDCALERRAGDRGVEPRVAVLETAVLPIHQSPGAPGL